MVVKNRQAVRTGTVTEIKIVSGIQALVLIAVLIFGPATFLGLLIQGARQIWIDDDPLAGAMTFVFAFFIFWSTIIFILALYH